MIKVKVNIMINKPFLKLYTNSKVLLILKCIKVNITMQILQL